MKNQEQTSNQLKEQAAQDAFFKTFKNHMPIPRMEVLTDYSLLMHSALEEGVPADTVATGMGMLHALHAYFIVLHGEPITIGQALEEGIG